jgi:hypothetical protein
MSASVAMREAGAGHETADYGLAVARAQQQTMPMIGFLSSRSPEDSKPHLDDFCGGLEPSDISMARQRRSNIAGPTDSMTN